jgi:hypothetical protein
MMNCEVSLPPELGLDPDEFSDVWNSLPRCRDEAHAGVEAKTESVAENARPAPILHNLEPSTVEEQLLPLLELVLEQLGVRNEVTMKPVTKADGSPAIELHTRQR